MPRLIHYVIYVVIKCCLSIECKKSETGEEYQGTIHTTVSGINCQRWDKQCPHKHGTDLELTNLTEAKNYCRNPDRSPGGPWCYADDESKRWEYCDVPVCGMFY